MNRHLDPTFDQRLADWLEDDPSTAPREVLGTVLAAFPSIEQRRASRVPWRNPFMNRYLLPIAAALIVAIGAVYLITRPASNIGPSPTGSPGSAAPTATPAPASIEGTWDVSFSRQEMLDAGIGDQGEDNDGNYGHFRLTFQSGWWAMSQVAPFNRPGDTATYTLGDGLVHLFSPLDNVTFDIPYTVTGTTLTMGLGGPVTFRVKPWTRVGTQVVTKSPEPRELSAYRQARNAVCQQLFLRSMPPDANEVTNPTGAIAVIEAVIARGNDEITQLSALDVPAEIKAEHDATIQATQQVISLLQHEIELINQGKASEVAAVDEQTGAYSTIIEQFEQKYALAGCP